RPSPFQSPALPILGGDVGRSSQSRSSRYDASRASCAAIELRAEPLWGQRPRAGDGARNAKLNTRPCTPSPSDRLPTLKEMRQYVKPELAASKARGANPTHAPQLTPP